MSVRTAIRVVRKGAVWSFLSIFPLFPRFFFAVLSFSIPVSSDHSVLDLRRGILLLFVLVFSFVALLFTAIVLSVVVIVAVVATVFVIVYCY